MRNLKRILSAALALVMSMSIATVASAAVDFDDAADINYDEAVAVMSTIGVLEGYNGEFDPAGSLTREQAAKIIAYMLLGDNANKLSVTDSRYTDVAANRWSAGVIEYCSEMGILAGNGDGTYNPEGKLTGYAFAKMLLGALGYKSDVEGFTGAAWTLNVANYAMQIGLDDGIEDIDWAAEITREQAAQMAMNAVKSPLVQYDKGATIIIDGQKVTFGSGDAYYVTTTLAKEQRISDQKLSNTNQYTVEFGERYFPNLILTDDQTDAFGRPAHTWTFKTEDIGTYTDKDLLVAQYTDEVKGKEAYNDIGYSIISQYQLYSYVDGAVCDHITKNVLTKSNNTKIAHTGRGTLTEVYVDHETEEITFVVINTYLAKVTADYNTKTENLPITAYIGINNTTTPVATSVGKTLNSDDFSGLDQFAKDDYVMVTLAADNHIDCENSPLYSKYSVQSIESAEVVSDVILNSYTMTEDNTADNNTYRLDTMTAQGTTYSTAAKAYFDAGVLYNYNEDRDQLKDCVYNLYTDPYGNVLGIELVEAADNYVFVVGYKVDYSPIAESIDQALIITVDGELKVVKARDDKAKEWNNSANSGKGGWVDMTDLTSDSAVNKWFTYTTDEDGTYILNKVAYYQGSTRVAAKSTTGADVSGVYADLTTNNTNTNDTVAESSVRPVAYGNNESIYIAVDADKNIDSDGSIVKVNSVTTGIKNTNIVAEGLYGQSMHNFNVANKGNTGAPANYHDTFFLYNSNGYVTYAVVVGEDMTSSDNMAFFATGATGRYYDSTLKGYYVTYDVIMGGELQTVKVLDAVATDADPARGDLFKATINADGYISALAGAASNVEYGDTLDRNMNTTAYKTSGYAQKSGSAIAPVQMKLVGATLWITNTTLASGKHVVINDDAKIFVKVGSESKYEQYNDIESALGVLANDGTAYVSRVTAICDKTTGYATTLIITETKGNSSVLPPVIGGTTEHAVMAGAGVLDVYDRVGVESSVDVIAKTFLQGAGYTVNNIVPVVGGEYMIYTTAGNGLPEVFTTNTIECYKVTAKVDATVSGWTFVASEYAYDGGTLTLSVASPSYTSSKTFSFTGTNVTFGTSGAATFTRSGSPVVGTYTAEYSVVVENIGANAEIELTSVT